MTNNHGGKRDGAGRPKGTVSVSAELREAAQKHTEDALKTLVDIMQDPSHLQRLKAAEMILARGYGEAKPEAESYRIITDFMNGDISAITACLMLEAEGLKVPEILSKYFKRELDRKCFHPFEDFIGQMITVPPEDLPRS